jgi:hypothetical protein
VKVAIAFHVRGWFESAFGSSSCSWVSGRKLTAFVITGLVPVIPMV